MLDFIKEWWWPILIFIPSIYVKTKAYFFTENTKNQKSSSKKVAFTGNIIPSGHLVSAVINPLNFDKLNKYKDKDLIINSALEEYFKNQEIS